MSREKFYTFTVPVTIRAVRTVCVKAENEDDACDKFRETDWYDCRTDEVEEEYQWSDVVLDKVQKLNERKSA
jgi:hypothetical protein